MTASEHDLASICLDTVIRRMLFELDNVQKLYGNLEALKGLTLRIEEGSVGLLGPNGAGKSTLIKVLLGLLEMSRGHASVLGHRVPDESHAIRQVVGYMPEDDCYLPYMTAVRYVSLMGELTGMPRAEAFSRAHQILYYVGLGEARYRKLSGFSAGMKQRVKLAQALVHGPKVVFLDEPTNGLDPTGRDEMLELIEDVKARGINVVLSSHILGDVERVCESVIMLNEGKLVHCGSIDELLGERGKHIVDLQTKEADEELMAALEERGFDARVEGFHVKVHLTDDQSPAQILEIAVDEGIQIRHFMPASLTLEKAFIGLLEEAADEELQGEPEPAPAS
ncbi:MAG: ATP-binding cassette domain-containing protein [Persicimonas sp.]